MDFKTHFWIALSFHIFQLGDQIKNIFLQKFYSDLGVESVFNIWIAQYIIENLGRNFSFDRIQVFISTHIITGLRLLLNIFLLTQAQKRLPEFEGYLARGFPGQISLRPPDIQPRRYDFPVGFQHDWRKIGSKKKKFQMYESQESTITIVESCD